MSHHSSQLPIAVITKATFAEADIICDIMNKVDSEITNKNLFIADNEEYISSHVKEHGCIFLACIENTPVGFLIIDIPGLSSKNLGYDLSLPPSVLKKSVHIDSVAVLSEYRGLGLQKKLLMYAEEKMKDEGYTSFFATVAPSNTPSLKSFFALNYSIGVTILKYHGVLRHVLQKHTNKTHSFSP